MSKWVPTEVSCGVRFLWQGVLTEKKNDSRNNTIVFNNFWVFNTNVKIIMFGFYFLLFLIVENLNTYISLSVTRLHINYYYKYLMLF